MYFSGFSAGSYSATALEVEYSPLEADLQEGGATVRALGCPVLYFAALMSPGFRAGSCSLVTDMRYCRIVHVHQDVLCPWTPTLEALSKLVARPRATEHPLPSLTIQYLDKGENVPWLDKFVHNYSHLLCVALPSQISLLAVRCDLAELCAYSNSYLPIDAFEELTAYVLSWAATIRSPPTMPYMPGSFAKRGQ